MGTGDDCGACWTITMQMQDATREAGREARLVLGNRNFIVGEICLGA